MQNRRKLSRPRRSTRLSKQQNDHSAGSATRPKRTYAAEHYAPNARNHESADAADTFARFSERSDRIDGVESDADKDRRPARGKKIAIGFILSLVAPFIVASILLAIFHPSFSIEEEMAFYAIWALSFGTGLYFFARTLFMRGQIFAAIGLTTVYVPVMSVGTLIYAVLFNCTVMNTCFSFAC
jgi:hypothetical protein